MINRILSSLFAKASGIYELITQERSRKLLQDSLNQCRWQWTSWQLRVPSIHLIRKIEKVPNKNMGQNRKTTITERSPVEKCTKVLELSRHYRPKGWREIWEVIFFLPRARLVESRNRAQNEILVLKRQSTPILDKGIHLFRAEIGMHVR